MVSFQAAAHSFFKTNVRGEEVKQHYRDDSLVFSSLSLSWALKAFYALSAASSSHTAHIRFMWRGAAMCSSHSRSDFTSCSEEEDI